MSIPHFEARITGGSVGVALQMLFFLLLLTFAFSTNVQAAAFSYENTTSTAIPDNNCPTYTAVSIPVTDNFTVNDLNIGINITHTYHADLIIRVKSPQGTTVVLSNKSGGSSDNFDILLDDSNATSITSLNTTHNTASPYYENLFSPANPLSAVNGENAQGNWALEVCDSANADTGTVNRVRLDFTGTAAANKDYGDAPASYGTPSHTMVSNLMIGTSIDADSASQPGASANGDDTNGSDDEDGLLTPPIIPTTSGQTYTLSARVTNTTNTTAYLTAYIDFNKDGDFNDSGEKSSTQGVYWSGYFYPSFTLPSGLTAGTTYARLRLSQTQAEAESPTASSSSGEVEDYVVTIANGPYYDYGDAPSSYGTARHTINNSIYLGSNKPDAETGSQNTYNASGDGVDEDGAPTQPGNTAVTLFPILKMTDTTYSVGIKATNTTGSSGQLYGWIDFDHNGTFDADEAASATVSNGTSGGTITLTWNSIPSDIKLGTTIIRLRLTTDTSVTTSTPSSNASNGEVEDFPIAVAQAIPADSTSVSIIKNETPASCTSTIFSDNFDDLPIEQYFGENTSATPYVVRDWTATGGGGDTYARTVSVSQFAATQGTSIYFGNGFVRRIYPAIGTGFTFDANGKLTTPLEAIELHDDIDDTTPGSSNQGESDWGPYPVTFSRSFSTTAGQKYRLYFSAIPEDPGGAYTSGIMRVDTPSGSIHFKAPGSNEGIQKYRVEFTATGSTSTISFVNYGHVGFSDGWCDPNAVFTSAWCTGSGGSSISGESANELIIDDVTVAATSACTSSGDISGFVYSDANTNDSFDSGTESGLGNITVTLYNENSTPGNTADDTLLETASTAADGSYSFHDLSTSATYRIVVDTADADLPAGASIGTANPLTGVTVTTGNTTANQNFGFDSGSGAAYSCSAPAPSGPSAYVDGAVGWSHNQDNPTAGQAANHPLPSIYNTGLIASAANEATSVLSTGRTDWAMYATTSSIPSTAALAISSSKYIQYAFTTQSSLSGYNILYGIGMATFSTGIGSNHTGAYKMQIQVDDNAAFSSPQIVKNQIQIDESTPTTGTSISEGPYDYGVAYYYNHYDFDTPVSLSPNTTYYVRLYLYDASKTGYIGGTTGRVIVDDLNLKTYTCTTGNITGTVYLDSNVNNTYDSGSESGIGNIAVSLYNENFTPGDTSDDTFIATTDSSASGFYSFSGLDNSQTYRIVVDTADTDLPVGATIGTINPLTAVTVPSGGITANKNFGFDPATMNKDYGDAPDTGSGTGAGNYRTKAADNGPSHIVVSGLAIGTKADIDDGSLQNANADADDTTGEDDEDGLVNPPIVPTTAGQTYTLSTFVTNTTYNPTYLTAYIDFNRDGDFLDAGEKAATQTINWNNFASATFTIPSGLTAGSVYARLRLSLNRAEAESPTGASASGEVEDYKLTVAAGPYYDYGDAPASYDSSNGGARHVINNNIYLGENKPDAESAAQSTFDATGDGLDEDGAPHSSAGSQVTRFPVLKNTDTSYSATFTVNNNTGAQGRLVGWIDFDQNGVFDADEGATATVPTGSSNAGVTLNWSSIPNDIKLGTTFIRLRLTTDSGVTTSTPTGSASNGEVEDFTIAVAMDIPPNSPSISVVNAATPAACETRIFEDNFNDITSEFNWGKNAPGSQDIRDWTRDGGGVDTYAQVQDKSGISQGMAVYFGNGAVREIYPPAPDGFTFDANGKLLTTISAIALRSAPDDHLLTDIDGGGASDWGPNPVTLSRSFATTPGKSYRLYFTAIPEEDESVTWSGGIMRVDAPGGSVHFKAPGETDGGIQHYAIEFTAVSATSTITFVNYGHVEPAFEDQCNPADPYSQPWCTISGAEDPLGNYYFGNELIIDDVVLTEAACSTGSISGVVYTDSNTNDSYDASTESGLNAVTVTLYDENATPGDTSDDRLVYTTSSAADGTYAFSNLNSARTYRIMADTTDTDLPVGATIGTTNPLTGVTVPANGTTVNKNFGFDPPPTACSAPSPTTTGVNSSITWNHNPYTPSSQTVGGHPVPAIINTDLIASAANEVASNLTVGPTDWEEYTETSSMPATLAAAISGNKYFQYSFTTKSSLANDHILYGVAMSTLGPANTWNHSGKYKMQIQIDDNAAFSSPTVIKNLIQIDESNPTTGGDVSEGPLYSSDYYISHYDLDTPVTLSASKTYYVRFYLYDVQTQGVANGVSNRIIFDDLILKTHDCGAPPPTLLSISDAVVVEGDSGLTYLNFPVQLSVSAPAGGISFDYATADETATLANNDYQSQAGTLTIPVGANGSVISVPVVGDTNIESNETIRLNVSNVVNAQYTNASYPEPPKGVIIDDDAATACDASGGDFGGMVFQDYNQNGIRETGEIGLSTVTVTAYNSSNAVAATTTTDADGWYKLTGLTNGSQYRLEFTNLPSGVESGAAGSDSATNVRFISASARCDADLGVYNPVDYCQANPKLLASRYVNGDTSIGSANMAGSYATLLSYNYNASGIAPTLSQDALGSQVGSIWGLAYNRHTKKAFATAMIKRHMGLGPLGIGGIYVVDYSGASPAVSNFLNVDGLAGIDAGSIGSNSSRGLSGDPYSPSHDPTAFDKVGKEGLGDAELSDDGNTLYVANLYSRKIIKIDLTAYNTSGTLPTTASEISLPSVSCSNGVARPFGLKYYRGKLYAGITCTGESGGTSADLKASVQAYDGSSWTEKLQVPLNYQNWHADHTRPTEYSRYNIPWVSSISQLTLGDHGSMDWADDAQLMLSGIEFDTNGDMLLGFIDRTGLQFGNYNYGTDTSSTRFYGVFSNGELLKAGYNASTGAYTLENAGTVNGVDGEGVKTGTDPDWPYGGPGGGEFFGGERFTGHTENSYGALALIPGRQELALNSMNPFNIATGGTIWLDNNTGRRTRGAQLYGDDTRFFGKAVGLGDIEVLCDTAPIEVGNRVWLDADSDGIQDAEESGVANVNVTLICGVDTATATTDAKGEYYFSNKTGGNATFMNEGENCTLSIDSSQAALSSYSLTTQNADGKTDNNRFTDIRDSDAANNSGTAEINFTVGSIGQNNHGLDFGYRSSYSNSYCVTPSGATGLLDLGDMSTSNISGVGSFTYSNRVLPGFGTVDVTVTQNSGVHFANTSAIDTGARQQTWLDQNLPVSGAAIYMGPGSGGVTSVTYDFNQPTGNVDLLVLDVDEDDVVSITALDSNGAAITDFSAWRYRSGDLSVWENPDPIAAAPAWNPATGTLTSTDDANDHRSFALLTPDTLVSQITVSFTAPAASGRHVYTILNTTDTGRDGETTCPAETSVSGKVWFDGNSDGIQNDGADAYIEGATVELYDPATSSIVATTTTNAAGEYQFSSSNGLQDSTSYQLRIHKLDNNSPVTGWAATTLHAGSDTTLDSDASLSGSYWVIDITSPDPASVMQVSGYGFGFTNTVATGCLDDGAAGISNESIANAHPNNYDFEFNSQHVVGFCTERTDGDPQSGDNYTANATDRQSLTALQREKIARSYSALTDPDIVFGIATAFGSGKNQQRLDDLLHYMTWYYTYYAEDLDAMSAAHLDTNSNYTAPQRIAMKVLAGKVADRVNGANGETQYPTQDVFWLWNMTSSTRQDIAVPAIYAAGSSCTAAGNISGTVYTDSNGNDVYDSGAESGIGSITVTLMNDTDGSTIASTSTNASGAYSFTNVSPALTYRIAVDTADTDLPAGASIGTTSPLTGVTVTASGTTSGQDFGFDASVAGSCGPVMTSIMPSGALSHTDNASRASVIGFDYNTRGTAASTPDPIELASAREVGTTWGQAYDELHKKLYVSAFLRRHADLSPDGLGAIYRIDVSNVSSNASVGTPSLWMDLNSSANLGAGATLFPSETAANRELGGAFAPSHDTWAYNRVGKQGIGGIDLSDDFTTLYAVDMTNRQLLEVDVATKTVIGRYPITDPGCAGGAGDVRPFGVDYLNGNAYVGVTCSGETNRTDTDVNAYVMKLSGGAFTTVVSGAKGLKWTYFWDDDPYNGGSCSSPNVNLYVPIITNMELDENGNMLIGVTGLNGFRFGSNNYTADTSCSTTVGLHETYGLVLRATPSGGNWTLANTEKFDNSGSTFTHFYKDGQYAHWGTGASHSYLGGLAVTDCSGQEVAIVNIMDPLDFESAGTRYMRTADGQHETAAFAGDTALATSTASTLEHYQGIGSTWEKSAGMGDLEFLNTDSPAVTTGNILGTVYSDANGDDAYNANSEAGIGSITVTLMNDADGSTIATTSTNADGAYSFTNASSTLTYRIAVDTADADLPAGASIGTTNPLTGVTVTAGGTTANQNFGFDPPVISSCPAPTANHAYSDLFIQWTHNANEPSGQSANHLKGWIRKPTYASSAGDEAFTNLTATIPNTATYIDTSSIPASVNGSKYISYSFTTPAFTGEASLYGVGLGIHADAQPTYSKRSGAYKVQVKIDTDPSFSSPTTLINSIGIDDTQVTLDAEKTWVMQDLGTSQYYFNHYQADQAETIQPNTTYYVRVYPYNASRAGHDDLVSGSNIIFDDFALKLQGCGKGNLAGTVYLDANGDNAYNTGTESGIGSISVDLYDENFTPGNTVDDTLIATTSTAGDGSYTFANVTSDATYRVKVDAGDPDLPSKAVIGTQNPLTNVTVPIGGTTGSQDFGFDISTLSCLPPVPSGASAYVNSAVDWTHNQDEPPGQAANHILPYIEQPSVIASAANEVISGLSGGVGDWSRYITRSSVPATVASAVSGNKYLQYSFTTKSSLPGETVLYGAGLATFAPGIGSNHSGAYQVQFQIDDNSAFSSPETVKSNIQIDESAPMTDADISEGPYNYGVWYYYSHYDFEKPIALQANKTYYLRAYLYDGTTGGYFAGQSDVVVFDDLHLKTYTCTGSTVNGKVFEDVDYGGGAGRDSTAAGAAGVTGASVELYDGSGNFVSTTSTDASGSYSFANVAAGNYYVRVVNNTVKSTRAGSDGTERGIQTYRTDGTTANTKEVGGRKPDSVDAAANATSQTLNTSTFVLSGGGQAQSVQPVTVSGSNLSGVNFGFNFSTVVNTNDSGQGSLRQGILNINLLANTGLAQAGQDNTYGVDTSVTKEVLLFNIPAASDPLGRADICGGSTCKITVSSQLPKVAKQPAIIDATTQPGYVAGTPGVPHIHITPAAGLDATGFIMDSDAPDSTFRGFAITGFRTKDTNRGLTINSEHTLVESNYIGVTPAGVADGNGNGIELQWTQSAIIGGSTAAKRNIVSGNQSLGIFYNTGAAGGNIQNNYIGTNPAGTAAMGNGTSGIDTEGGSGTKILDNIIAGNLGNGIELGFTTGGPGLANAIIQGNRIGVGVNGEAIPNWVGIMNYGVSNGHTIGGTGAGQANIIAYNSTGGIKMYNNSSSGVVISGNSIYANGNLGIDLGNDGVTVNDANDADSGANNLINFPILSTLAPSGGNLIIKGCAPAGATVELFEADVSPGGAATPGDNKQGKSKDYGEGQTYLASFVESGGSDTDNSDCALATEADGNDQTGMKAFSVTIPTPAGFVTGDVMTATATVSGTGTSEFCPTITLYPLANISGKVFEDVNYGGDIGRPFGTAGTTGISGAVLEIYNSGGAFVSSTTTAADGSYTLADIPGGNYYVRVVNSAVSSTRGGSDGSELGVMTYRSNGASAVTSEIGGRNPAAADADAHDGVALLDTTTFVFSGGTLDGGQAQSIQPIALLGADISGADFGFNFDTVVNANDAGQGSLRQVMLNANLLGGDASLAQTGRAAGKENLILQLLTSDPNYVDPDSVAANGDEYWHIDLQSSLPPISSPLILDGTTQTGFVASPVLQLNGASADATTNGLYFISGSDGSTVQALNIQRFGASGILLEDSANNLIGGDLANKGNIIINNGGNNGDGVTVSGAMALGNTILGNGISGNSGLGINLAGGTEDAYGVTENDAGDTDTGPNDLLNYPDTPSNAFGANGTKIVTYNFDLDVPPGDYRVEFFLNTAADTSGHGEGETFIGFKNIAYDSTNSGSVNFKGTFNANRTINTDDLVTATLTQRVGPSGYGTTSEFSGTKGGTPSQVCTDLIDNPGDALPDLMIDENSITITLLEAKDSNGDPITYVISSTADGDLFTLVDPPTTDPTLDCTEVEFVHSGGPITKASTPGAVVLPDPGDYEVPIDQGQDNVYDIAITATDIHGNQYTKTLSTQVLDVNEAPIITSGATASITEDGATQVLDINSQDEDAGDTESVNLHYSLSGGADQAKFAIDPLSGVLSFKSAPDYDKPADSNLDNVYEVNVSVTDPGGLSATKTFKVSVLNSTADDSLKLKARALLQGAYNSAAQLMRDDLRQLDLLPAAQPYNSAPFSYAGVETLPFPLLAVEDNNAIVDWILVELRDPADSSHIIARQAALLQRDGDIMDANGQNTLEFSGVPAGSYYVAVRHRNHLGVMSATPLALDTANAALVDFASAATATLGDYSRFISNGLALLWVGDVNGSKTLSASGPGNDATALVGMILTAPGNTDANTNYVLPGYAVSDLNMDGKTLFTGPNNDITPLLGNIIMHPANTSFAANYIVRGGLLQ